MKVIAVSGGSKNGSNDAMAREALMGAQEAGAEIEFIRLLDLDLKPCTGCIACVNSLMTGGNGDCVIKDDEKWLDEKFLEADAVIFVMPVFEKGTPGIMHIVQDRLFGPGHDIGTNIVAGKIAEKMGKPGPDPRKLRPKATSFIAIGGSDWTSKVSCDFNLLAMSTMWKVIDDEVFNWSKSIILDDEAVKKCHQIGVNIANAAKDIQNAKYLGLPGICPHCNSRNFFLAPTGMAICVVCGIEGKLIPKGDSMEFVFEPEQLGHAHDNVPGKMIHMDDIYRNETKLAEQKKTPAFKERNDKYKAFIQGSKPERA